MTIPIAVGVDVKTALQCIPMPVRLGIYVAVIVAGPVMIYLQAKGIIGADEWTLYASLATIFGVTAAGNVTTGSPPDVLVPPEQVPALDPDAQVVAGVQDDLGTYTPERAAP